MKYLEGARVLAGIGEAIAPAEMRLAEEVGEQVLGKIGFSKFFARSAKAGKLGAASDEAHELNCALQGLEATAGNPVNSVVSFASKAVRRLGELPHDLRAYSPALNAVDKANAKDAKVLKLVESEIGYRVLGRMKRGTNGAYLLEDKTGTEHVFKLVATEDVTPQINRSAGAAAAVDSLGGRTPRYEEVRFTPGSGSWYMQEVLPGRPAPVPSDRLIGQMVHLNLRQTNQAVQGMTDWNDKITGAVLQDSLGWKKNIAASGADGAALVTRIEELLGGKAPAFTHAGDIVHGDFQHFNALVTPTDRMTGYVDWEGAGRGDRTIDLSRLLYDAYVSEPECNYKANADTLKMLSQRISEISGPEILRAEMGYWVLQVADFGAKVGKEHLAMFTKVGQRIASDLAELTPSSSSPLSTSTLGTNRVLRRFKSVPGLT